MSKTITNIALVAAAVAVNVIPGAGQALSAGIVTAITSAGVAAGLSLASSAFAKSPKADLASTAIKTERPPRTAGYGRYKTFGAYICYETAANGSAVDAWAFHEGQIDGIEAWYLGDKKVTRLANGFVQKGEAGQYGDSDTIQIGANLGLPVETAHAPVIAALPDVWTADHRGDGVVTGYMISKAVKAANYQKIYPSGGPNQTPLALVIRAQLVYDWRDGAQSPTDPRTWKWSENAVLHTAHYILVREAIGPTRPPNDPAYWTDIADIYGARWSRLFARTLDYWTAAADDADSPVPLKAGGTEPRYRSCVSHKLAGEGSEHKAVKAALLACFDGWLSPREDGALVVYSGRYYAPTVTISPDIIVGYTVEDGVEDENAVNQIGVTYVSAEHDYNTVDTDPWTNEADILARGAIRSDDLANQVPSHGQGRRLAKREESKRMAPKRGTVTALAAGVVLLSERFVTLSLVEGAGTHDEFIAYSGPVEITGATRNLQTGAVQASWIAADPSIDTWNPAIEEGNPAPVEGRVERTDLATPSIISATAQFSAVGQNPDGADDTGEPVNGGQSTGARILIAASGPDRADLTWYARWRVGASGSWNEREYPDADPGPGVSFLTEFVPLASNVNVQTSYTVGDGRRSNWSASVVVDTRKN